MRPRVIVVSGVFLDHTAQVFAMEDERVVEAFPFQAANPSLADNIRFRCSIGCPQLLDAAARGDRCEELAILLVTVVNEVLGPDPREWLPEAAARPTRLWGKASQQCARCGESLAR